MKFSELLDTSPKWQHKDASVRLQSVKNSTLEPDILAELASSDPDLDVRLNSISQIRDVTVLMGLIRSDTPEVSSGAIEQYTSVIGSDLSKFNLIDDKLPPALLFSLVVGAEQLDMKHKAASLISDKDLLTKILSTPNHSKIHQLCATTICSVEPGDENTLEILLKQFQDKDKNVARIIKGRLQSSKNAREQAESSKAEMDKNLQALEKLADGQYVDDFERRLSVLKDKWQSLQHQSPSAITSDILQRFATAISLCQQKIEDRVNEIADRTAATGEIITTLETLTNSLQTSAEKIDTVDDVISELRKHWPVEQDLAPFYALTEPLEDLYRHYLSWCKLEKRLGSLKPAEINSQLSKLHWPKNFSEPAEVAVARKQMESSLEQKKQARTDHKAKLEDLGHLLDQLEKAIDEGHLKPANKLLTSINKSLGDLNAPQKDQNRIHQLETKLRELRDWQGYATNPKREELCSSMERLAKDLTISPQEKSQAIKELQDQWKKLGASDDRQAQRLWSQFKRHSDIAYKPCAEYFASQKLLREQNLSEREKICTSLELYIQENDWEQTNWKKVFDILNKARHEWRKYNDIPRSKRRKIQDRFTKAIDALQSKIKEEQNHNHEAKTKLIEEIRSFSENELPISELVEKTKAIQSRWKSIGITDHRVDQKLWKQFRAECDSVFNRRDESIAAKKEQANEKTVAVRNLLGSFATVLQSDEPINQSDINKFKKEFNSKELPKEANSIRGEFKRLLKTAHKIISQQARSSSIQMMSELKRLSAICSRHENKEIDLDTLEKEWHSDITLDKPMQSGIEQRRQGKTIADESDAERLCIQLEILAGVESPPESAESRMAYQVERLNRELSQGKKETRPVEVQIRDIQISWYCLPANAINAKLLNRFNHLESKLGV